MERRGRGGVSGGEGQGRDEWRGKLGSLNRSVAGGSSRCVEDNCVL